MRLGGPQQSLGTFDWTNSDTPLFEVTTQRGHSIQCAIGHRFWVRSSEGDRWKSVDAVQPGDELAIVGYREATTDHAADDFDLGWLLGHIKGNGGHNPHKSGRTYLRFWAYDDGPLIDRASRLLESLGARVDFGSGDRFADIVTLQTAHLSDFVSGYLTAGAKTAKRALIEASTDMVAGYLQGFFDADGTVQSGTAKGRSVRLNQSNLEDLKTVQRMLLRLGVASTIYPRHPSKLKEMPDGKGGSKLYNVKENWDLHIGGDNVEQFSNVVSLSQASKKERLELATSTLKRRPNAEHFFAKIAAVNQRGSGPSIVWRSDSMEAYDANGIRSLDISPPPRSR